jgi:hypothetical protein
MRLSQLHRKPPSGGFFVATAVLTSSSQNITNKYNLSFELSGRHGDFPPDAKALWHQILEKTLNADDLKEPLPTD